MPEAKRRLLDSWADHLRKAQSHGGALLINEINVGEVYYIVARHRSVEDAERTLDHLETLPLQIVGNTFDDVLDAARVKANHAVSYADAFAVATAARFGATVVTGDPEFEAVEDLVTVEWLA